MVLRHSEAKVSEGVHAPVPIAVTYIGRAKARTWADLLEAALPAALQEAAVQEVALRRATPVDFTE